MLVTVGTLVERKGFHRVMEAMPALLKAMPDLHYLAVGGPGAEGDDSAMLQAKVAELGLGDRVRFLGPVAPDSLHVPLSAANVFVLPSRYEGWANVLLEAMACGLPVVATDVGGNAQVVAHAGLGRVVPFGDETALTTALVECLKAEWDRRAIRAYAEANSWEARIPQVVSVFDGLVGHVDHAAARHEVRRVDDKHNGRESLAGAPVRAVRGAGLADHETHDAR